MIPRSKSIPADVVTGTDRKCPGMLKVPKQAKRTVSESAEVAKILKATISIGGTHR